MIADHSALPGQGISVNKTLHRIEEATLQKEIEAAGFKQVGEGNFWRNPADTHDFPSYKPNMPVDNFVLKFQKPITCLILRRPREARPAKDAAATLWPRPSRLGAFAPSASG